LKHVFTLISAVVFITGFTSNATAEDADAAALAAKYNCNGCHAVDHKVVGPGYRDVAKKYAGDAAAPANLAAKIKSGGSGAWGSFPMPPNSVPDADLKPLVAWILSKG
jgi:cytochrome c